MNYIENASTLIRNGMEKIDAVHLDIVTPFDINEVGDKAIEYEDKLLGVPEMNLFSSFDVVVHRNKPKDLYLINLLKKRYSV